jgi:hypothetical protein
MSLRARVQAREHQDAHKKKLYEQFGFYENPFPSSNQTSGHPHYLTKADEDVENSIADFLGKPHSDVVVVEASQGVGKTNFLNHFEREIADALSEMDGYYVVRYLADPESSFDGVIRRLLQEFGVAHLEMLGEKLQRRPKLADEARSADMRSALGRLAEAADTDEETPRAMLEWLLGERLLKRHRELLSVHYRLDTVESRTAALSDLVSVSQRAKILEGIFLLLDELEKQDGVLGPTAVVRYLSSLRAIIDALPQCLFMMLALTPDAMRRYSLALPALRSRLQHRVILEPLYSLEEATNLAEFYISHAREKAQEIAPSRRPGQQAILTKTEMAEHYRKLEKEGANLAVEGVRQRDFLNALHRSAAQRLSEAKEVSGD